MRMAETHDLGEGASIHQRGHQRRIGVAGAPTLTNP